MESLKYSEIVDYVEKNISAFHEKRIERLNKLKLKTVLRKKNPYLFKAKNVLSASDIVESISSAFISSNEETIFGDWLEGLAIFVNKKAFGGWKSGIRGIDLEFDKSNIRYIFNIKSGPNWGNSSQIAKMKSDFTAAKRTLRTSNSKIVVVAINGCCYGKDKRPDKGEYYKYCGQEFWAFISGNENLYTEIIEPLGHRAKEKNEAFHVSYTRMINNFTKDFIESFCKSNGDINWEKLVEFNSGK